jgi:hypothetical protein
MNKEHNISAGEVHRYIGQKLKQWIPNQICNDGRYDDGVCGYGGEGCIPCKHGYSESHEISPPNYSKPDGYCVAICDIIDVLKATVTISPFSNGVVMVVVNKGFIRGEYASNNLGLSTGYAIYDFLKNLESDALQNS